MERLSSRKSKVATTRTHESACTYSDFSTCNGVYRQRLALLHIQRSSSHVANDITEDISRVDYAAGSLDLFPKSPEQFHLRQHSLTLSMM